MLERIVINPNVQHGKPCIKGTRMPAYVILEALATEMSYEEIKEQYPPLENADIDACIQYAAMLANEQEVVSQVEVGR